MRRDLFQTKLFDRLAQHFVLFSEIRVGWLFCRWCARCCHDLFLHVESDGTSVRPERSRCPYHAVSILTSNCPGPTTSPDLTSIDLTMPSIAARMVCSIFIASSTSKGSPVDTFCPSSIRTFRTFPGIGELAEPCSRSLCRTGYRDNLMTVCEPSDE